MKKSLQRTSKNFTLPVLNEDIINYDVQEGIYCILGNTYIFPPRAAWRFLSKVEEFKSKFMKDFPHTRYDLRVIYPRDDQGLNIVNTFYNSLQGETKDIYRGRKIRKTCNV